MGLCASQARLLMLTARKSDLEYRRMQITNAKQMLAMQEEEIATKYSNALNNRQYTTTIDGKEVVITGANIATAFGNTSYGLHQDAAKIQSRFGKDYTQLNSTEIYEAFEAGLLWASDGQNNKVSMGSCADFKDGYFTEDDGAAEAEYNSEMAKIKRKETALDLEAQQIETQHSAVSTEIEAVQSLVKKNYEKSFKYFS
jgi:hypothetical protein